MKDDHKIRIIAGKHRGRKIPVRDADGLRPTPNRARDKSCAGGIIRIIAGKHRGRKIPVRDADGLRPTPNRARETLFNWLQFELSGAHVVDAFAGSGALGLEALSRGAASALFIEQNPANVTQLRQILQQWQEAHGNVLHSDAFHLPPSHRYDVIFLDPPFAAECHQRAIDYFARDNYLKPHGKIYLEMPVGTALTLPAGFVWQKQSHAGRVHFGLIARAENAA